VIFIVIGMYRSHDHLVWLREWQALGYTADQWVRVLHRGLTPQQAERKETEAIAFHKKQGHQLFNDQLNKGGKRRPVGGIQKEDTRCIDSCLRPRTRTNSYNAVLPHWCM
jgi:hypothetical protein